MSRLRPWGVSILLLGSLHAGCRTARLERAEKGSTPSRTALDYGRAIVGEGDHAAIRRLLSTQARADISRATRENALRRFRSALPESHGPPEVSVAAIEEIRGSRGTVLLVAKFTVAGEYLLLGVPVVMEKDWRVEPSSSSFPARELRRGKIGEIEGKRSVDFIRWVTGEKEEAPPAVVAAKSPEPTEDYLVARCLLDMGEAESALPFFKRALADDPDLPGLREAIRRAEEEAKTGGGKETMPVSPERAALTTCIRAGRRYFDEGAYRKAVEEFEKALALDGQNSEAIQYLRKAKERIKGRR